MARSVTAQCSAPTGVHAIAQSWWYCLPQSIFIPWGVAWWICAGNKPSLGMKAVAWDTDVRCLYHSHYPDISHNPDSLVKRRVWAWNAASFSLRSNQEREPCSNPCATSWIILQNQWTFLPAPRLKRKKAAMWSHTKIGYYQLVKKQFLSQHVCCRHKGLKSLEALPQAPSSCMISVCVFLVKCTSEEKRLW